MALPVRLKIAHSLTASSNSGSLHWLHGRPWSYLPAPSSDLHRFLLSGGFVGLPPVRSGESSAVSRNRYGRTRSGEVRLGPGGWLSGSADLLSPRDDCILVVFLVRVANIMPPCSGSAVSPLTVRCLLLLWFLRDSSREFGLWSLGLIRTLGPLGIPVIRTLQRIRHIYQCQLNWSSSEGVGVNGSTIIRRTSGALTVAATARA